MTITQSTTLDVRPLTGTIGAELWGVDLTKPLTDDEHRFIHDALMEWGVVFFRDQPLDFDQHLALGRRFGDLHIHPAAPSPEGHPEILIIHADENSKRVAGEGWHSDVSADPEPPMGSILHLERVPPSGGDTLFANMAAAYDDLSEPMKEFLCGLTATHGSEHVYRGRYDIDDQGKEFPEAHHPVVRTHPVTGRRTLFVNSGFTTRIDGLRKAESDALLGMLIDHINNPKFHCRFRWQPHSVAFWDNRAVQHLAVWDYYPQVRSGFRVTLKGDRPYFTP
jgi:taurine dioxygenase